SSRLLDPRQFLQHAPVFQPILLSGQQCGRGVAVFVELLREAALGTGEIAEVDLLARLGVDVPILFYAGIPNQAEALLEARALPRIVDEYWEAARVSGELSLVFRHVVGDPVLRLAR